MREILHRQKIHGEPENSAGCGRSHAPFRDRDFADCDRVAPRDRRIGNFLLFTISGKAIISQITPLIPVTKDPSINQPRESAYEPFRQHKEHKAWAFAASRSSGCRLYQNFLFLFARRCGFPNLDLRRKRLQQAAGFIRDRFNALRRKCRITNARSRVNAASDSAVSLSARGYVRRR